VEDLRAAVDDYMVAMDPSKSMAAQVYGYPIGTWNVSKLTDFSHVFSPHFCGRGDTLRARLRDFDDDLLGWDVSSATCVYGMFKGCSHFHKKRKVANFGRDQMEAATAEHVISNKEGLIKAIDEYVCSDEPMGCKSAQRYGYPIGTWDVSKIADFEDAFSPVVRASLEARKRLKAFDEDLSGWNMSSAVTIARMFCGCTKFNGDVSTWDVSRVEDMEATFCRCTNFNRDLSRWNVCSVKLAYYLFWGTFKFRGDVSSWKTFLVRNNANTSHAFVNSNCPVQHRF